MCLLISQILLLQHLHGQIGKMSYGYQVSSINITIYRQLKEKIGNLNVVYNIFLFIP